jgi:hypothetical protein
VAANAKTNKNTTNIFFISAPVISLMDVGRQFQWLLPKWPAMHSEFRLMMSAAPTVSSTAAGRLSRPHLLHLLGVPLMHLLRLLLVALLGLLRFLLIRGLLSLLLMFLVLLLLEFLAILALLRDGLVLLLLIFLVLLRVPRLRDRRACHGRQILGMDCRVGAIRCRHSR